MSTEHPPQASSVQPITTLEDPRAITLLTTEHWSLLSARSLAYNEAFVRAGMFLTFLSMSFVGLALLAEPMAFERDFLAVAALVLTFDLIIGLTTFLRIGGANTDDLRALHGMARIRHAYTEITPIVVPYFTTPTYDDFEAVVSGYGPIGERPVDQIVYGLTTSGGMVGLIVSLVGGVLTTVVALLIGFIPSAAIWMGVAGGVVVLGALIAYSMSTVAQTEAVVTARFPTPAATAAASAGEDAA